MMQTYNIEKVVSKNGTVQLETLPFPPGELVEVIVRARQGRAAMAYTRTLKGTALKFELPFEPVAEEEWDALHRERNHSGVFDLFTQTSLDQALAPGFFQQHNPLVRHIVLRRRETLENQGLLERVGVAVHPDPKMGANAYPIFGGLPDAIEDEWIENIEELETQMDQYIHLRQQARNAFDLRYESGIEPESNRWELCSRVLSRRDIIAKLSEPW